MANKQHKSAEEYVTCAVCLHKYVGKIPKGGDGSVMFPRRHTHNVPIETYGYRGPKIGKEVCPGSYEEALEYKEK